VLALASGSHYHFRNYILEYTITVNRKWKKAILGRQSSFLKWSKHFWEVYRRLQQVIAFSQRRFFVFSIFLPTGVSFFDRSLLINFAMLL